MWRGRARPVNHSGLVDVGECDEPQDSQGAADVVLLRKPCGLRDCQTPSRGCEELLVGLSFHRSFVLCGLRQSVHIEGYADTALVAPAGAAVGRCRSLTC
jgi:hypothetical protein